MSRKSCYGSSNSCVICVKEIAAMCVNAIDSTMLLSILYNNTYMYININIYYP